MRVHLRKPTTQVVTGKQLLVGELSVDLNSREVKRSDRLIDLTPREFDLLVCLLKNKNIVLTREQLIDQVWGYDYFGDTNVVDVYIRYLRQKIDNVFDKSYVLTVQ